MDKFKTTSCSQCGYDYQCVNIKCEKDSKLCINLCRICEIEVESIRKIKKECEKTRIDSKNKKLWTLGIRSKCSCCVCKVVNCWCDGVSHLKNFYIFAPNSKLILCKPCFYEKFDSNYEVNDEITLKFFCDLRIS